MKSLYMLAVAAACVPGIAAAQDSDTRASHFDGVRAEARIGYETPTISDSTGVYKIGSAVSGGGEIGFDLKAGKSVVVGPYAVYEFSSVKVCDGLDCLKEDGNLGVGGRLGVAVGDNVLLYAKAGYARIGFSVSSGTVTGSTSKDGVQGAIGANLNFGKRVYGMLEFNYADYGSFFGVNLQRRHVAAGVGLRF
jgi:outer membrane immunogenic protein